MLLPFSERLVPLRGFLVLNLGRQLGRRETNRLEIRLDVLVQVDKVAVSLVDVPLPIVHGG